MNSAADPFDENPAGLERRWYRVLGYPVCLESADSALLELSDAAFAGPVKRVARRPDAPRVRLRLANDPVARRWRRPPRPRLASGSGLLGCSFDADNFAWISAESGRACVSISPAMLRFPYHARYELIEFAVLTLLTRAHGLVPLHAACVGTRDRAVLLLGGSGAGKSTACLHALGAGLSLVSEDSVFVRPDTLDAAGLNAYLHLRGRNPELARPWLESAIRSAPWIRRRSGVRKVEIDVRRAGAPRAGLQVKIAATVLLEPAAANGGAALRQLGWRKLRAALAATQPYASRQAGWREFCEQVAKLPAYEMRRTHPARTAEILKALVSRREAMA